MVAEIVRSMNLKDVPPQRDVTFTDVILTEVTITDWITAGAALLALGLSIRNAIVQHRDRTPRVELLRSCTYVAT